ncbi:MAG: hypothetical protein HJJLKODD_00898 [Phycisphaerae bacterium]|nr:hypothetical protein [Phycisphaerae bacterium]
MMEIEHPSRAVMFTDICGYSRMMSEDEAGALALLEEHNQIMEAVVEAHGGRVVKKLGDSYMVVFDGADAAVKCGLHALNKIGARNRKSTRKLEIRVGVHEGAMLEREQDFFGETVNIAARLEQMSKPMTVTASERVLQEVATRLKAEARFVGPCVLKHIRYPVSVYELTPADNWKLYLGQEMATLESDATDLLSELGGAEAVWRQIEELIEQGDLHASTQLAEAALGRFGGKFRDYARLAALYQIAQMESDAQSALKMGEMLGQRQGEDEQWDWLEMLLNSGEAGLRRNPDQLIECLSRALSYLAGNFGDLVMRVLVEGVRCRLQGQLAGLAALAQQRSDSALVLRGYAEGLRDLQQRADAYRLLDQAIEVAPNVADHQLRRLQWMVEDDDLPAVRDEVTRLVKNFPKDARVYQWTGKLRLLDQDPAGAQWLFEQAHEGPRSRWVDSTGWLICSLMQQGRMEQGIELARREMRTAIRQSRQRPARAYLEIATIGIYLQHWDSVLETLEEYRRYDSEWWWPTAVLTAAKLQRKLLNWDRALAQLGELALRQPTLDHAHPSAIVALPLLLTADEESQWFAVQEQEYLRQHRDDLLKQSELGSLAVLVRGAWRYGVLDSWFAGLVPTLSGLSARMHPLAPLLLASSGLIQVRLNNPEGGRPLLEQARKLWRTTDWAVWEIQEAESVLAGATRES